MNKSFTRSFLQQIQCDAIKRRLLRIKFLQDYCRAFSCIETKSIGTYNQFLN
jgi:hypothetical protein